MPRPLLASFLPLLLLVLGGAACRGPRTAQALPPTHPLLAHGRPYDAREDRPAEVAALVKELAGARYVMLGERHDNPHHHALQAALVRAMVEAGRRPVLALEMLDVSQQAQVDAALAEAPRDPDALARAVGWERSGWPDWALYRPVVAAALEAGLPVVAANLPREQARRLVREGPGALPEAERERLGLSTPLPPEAARALLDELRESHCGALPEAMLAGLMLAQRARDAVMARRLVETDRGDGAILITGAGHARTDRGVPARLAQLAPGRTVRSVGFLEAPQSQAALASQPFDFVWVTPGVDRGDPCAALRRHGGR